MANHLNMAQTHSIEVLLKRGWSQRRVARDLGIDRGTVSKVFKRLNAPEVTSTTPSKPGPPAARRQQQRLPASPRPHPGQARTWTQCRAHLLRPPSGGRLRAFLSIRQTLRP